MKVTEVLIFPNGNIAAFDEHGQQIPDMQHKSVSQLIAEQANRLGYSVDGCKVCMGRGVTTMMMYSGYREIWEDAT